MIDLSQIEGYFAPLVQANPAFKKYMLKEYIQLLILDFLSTTPFSHKLTFIGGTNLRLVKGIDRFSEDLDFDCKNLSHDEFLAMTDAIVVYLRRNGLPAEVRQKESSNLTAFRRSIYFPEMLYNLGLSAYREEKFLIKIEAQDQGYNYASEVVNIKRMGFFFPIQVPPMGILSSMKLSALLHRGKGRDFYDTIFLLSQTEPDYGYLAAKCGISDLAELKATLIETVASTNLERKSQDFLHLLFDTNKSTKILSFKDFVEAL